MKDSAQNFLTGFGSKETFFLFTFSTFLPIAVFTCVYSQSLFCAHTERSVFGAASIVLQQELQCQKESKFWRPCKHNSTGFLLFIYCLCSDAQYICQYIASNDEMY